MRADEFVSCLWVTGTVLQCYDIGFYGFTFYWYDGTVVLCMLCGIIDGEDEQKERPQETGETSAVK